MKQKKQLFHPVALAVVLALALARPESRAAEPAGQVPLPVHVYAQLTKTIRNATSAVWNLHAGRQEEQRPLRRSRSLGVAGDHMSSPVI